MLIIGKRGFTRFGSRLAALGYQALPLEPLPGLNRIVADHADTLFFDCGELLTSREVAELNRLGERVMVSSDCPRGDYPGDIRFNALALGKSVYGRLDALSPDVKALAERRGMKLVNVRQGYARCSVLPLTDAAITADIGLAAAMRREGVEVLTIPPGGIRLEGCGYGFIGGASFVDFEKRRAVFFGSFGDSPGEPVRAFCRAHGFEPVELPGELTDVGGAVMLR